MLPLLMRLAWSSPWVTRKCTILIAAPGKLESNVPTALGWNIGH